MPRRIRARKYSVDDRLRDLPREIAEQEIALANGWLRVGRENWPADWRTRKHDGRSPIPAAVRRLGGLPIADSA